MKKFCIACLAIFALVVFFGCRKGTQTVEQEPPKDNSGDNSTDTSETDASEYEEIDITTDEEIAQKAANEINTKFSDEHNAGNIKAQDDEVISLGLVYTRDESGKGDESYAFSFADMILEFLSQISGKCFKIVSTDETRQKLIETSSQLLDAAFDSSKAFEELGKQIPVNFGFFVEVKPATGLEKVSLKIYLVQTGELFFGKSYTYNSDYLNYVEEAKKAEEQGDMQQAASLLEQASTERGGKDPNLEKRKQRIVKDLPPEMQQALRELRVIGDRIKKIHYSIKQCLEHKRFAKHELEEKRNYLVQVRPEIEKLRSPLGINAKKALDDLLRLIETDIDACNRLIMMINKGLKPSSDFRFRILKHPGNRPGSNPSYHH